MEKVKNEGWGINSVTVIIDIADAFKLSTVLQHLDRYDELCKEGIVDKIDAETGEIITTDPIEIAKSEGWEPMDELMKLRKFCKKLCFVNAGQSNIFDDEEDENSKAKVRK